MTHTINHSQSQGQPRFKKRNGIYLLIGNWQGNCKKLRGMATIVIAIFGNTIYHKVQNKTTKNFFLTHQIGKNLKVDKRLKRNRHPHIFQVGIWYTSYEGELGKITLRHSNHNPTSTFMNCSHAHFVNFTFLGPSRADSGKALIFENLFKIS